MASYRESFIVRIASDPAALLWSGVGLLPLAADDILPEDAIAVGGGELVSLPDFQQLLNGTAERLDFTLSGVSQRVLDLAFEEAPSVEGARVDLGRIDFDENWQQVGAVEWEAVFEARSLNISRPRSQNGQTTRSITLSIVQGDTARSRSPAAFFTDADQRRKSASDAIFSHVAKMTGGATRRFGPK